MLPANDSQTLGGYQPYRIDCHHHYDAQDSVAVSPMGNPASSQPPQRQHDAMTSNRHNAAPPDRDYQRRIRPLLGAALHTAAITPLMRWAIIAHVVPTSRQRQGACRICATPIGLTPPADPTALSARARCGTCGTRIGPPPYTLEAGALLAVITLPCSGLRGWELAAYAWWTALALILSMVDLAVHRLPDRLVLACGGGFIALMTPLGITTHPHEWLRAVSAGCVMAAVFGLAAVLPLGGLGLGDAKFAATAGAATGWISWFTTVTTAFVSFTALALVGLFLIAARRAHWSTRLPYGPFLATTSFVMVQLPAVGSHGS